VSGAQVEERKFCGRNNFVVAETRAATAPEERRGYLALIGVAIFESATTGLGVSLLLRGRQETTA
jgi:hypothetical protein